MVERLLLWWYHKDKGKEVVKVLADNLVLLRNMKGMTQEEVAEVIGISRQSYSKWEQGQTFPDINKCAELA